MSTDLTAIAETARTVPGVAGAFVDPDERGGVGALRLDLVPGTDGTSVAGQVSRLLVERFGSAVEPDRVHVVDATDAPAQRVLGPVVPGVAVAPVGLAPAVPPTASATVPAAGRRARLTVVRSDAVVTGLETSTTVVLACAGRAATGEARAAATGSGAQRSTAQATLRAVERLLGDRARFELEQLEVAGSGDAQAVLVGLSMVTSRGTERLAGAAVVRDDAGRTVVRAVLAALNRRLEALLA